MKIIKKSFNVDPDLAQQVDDFIRDNPGVSFTLAMNQALRQWLGDPKIQLKRQKATDKDVEKFIKDNRELMDSLRK